MAIGLDVGTMNIVCSKKLSDGEEVLIQRNCYYKLKAKDDSYADTLDKAQAKYIEYNGNVFIIGEDALRYSGISSNTKDFHRSMKDGVLNPEENDGPIILGEIIKSMVPAAEPGNVVVFTCPAAPIDGAFDTTYHKMVLKRVLKSLGYKPVPINEARALVFAAAPTVETAEGPAKFSAISISVGGGMTNLAVVWKGDSIIEMSVQRGGDFIDASVAKVTNSPVSMVTIVKENELDLLATPSGKNRKILEALQIYYDALIDDICEAFEDKFTELKSTINDTMPIIVGGGTATVNGFIQKLDNAVRNTDMPFEIGTITLVENPLVAVSSGCLVSAINLESRSK
jgi:actin-like ATPase involved in cell morphogenesis